MQLNFNGTHHRSHLVLECKTLKTYSLQNNYQRKTKNKPPHDMPTSKASQKWGPPSTGWPHRKELIWLPRAAKKHSLEGAAFTVQMETLRPRPSNYFPKLAWPPVFLDTASSRALSPAVSVCTFAPVSYIWLLAWHHNKRKLAWNF